MDIISSVSGKARVIGFGRAFALLLSHMLGRKRPIKKAPAVNNNALLGGWRVMVTAKKRPPSLAAARKRRPKKPVTVMPPGIPAMIRFSCNLVMLVAGVK